MTDPDRRRHWDEVYVSKDETGVSWFQDVPEVSLELIDALGATPDAAIIDVGGGASRLVDALLARGFGDLTVLDLSSAALAASRARLGGMAGRVAWIAADVCAWEPARTYDVWHDRAAFHFLTEASDQAAYVARLRRALRPGGHVVIGTFAPDGPQRCSGLPVMRHDSDSLARVIGPEFALVAHRRHEHRTPAGAIQRFQFSVFRRAG